MSKASVAQEPSMDEILASIRRIIETGDEKAASTSREAAVGAARQIPAFLAGEAVRDIGEPQASPGASAPLTFPSFREPSPAARYVDEPVGAAQPLFPAVTDDDRLTAELETELAATWERIEIDRDPDGFPVPVPMGATADHASDRNDAVSREPDMHAFGERDDASSQPHTTEPAAVWPSVAPSSPSYEAPMERNAFEPANTDARLQDDPPTASSRYGDSPPPLVSPTTGQLVGASFNELAEAIRQGELRSLEAMAQEMLQPMLREWLDDNLPRMVERLIREEIERLARGGARR